MITWTEDDAFGEAVADTPPIASALATDGLSNKQAIAERYL